MRSDAITRVEAQRWGGLTAYTLSRADGRAGLRARVLSLGGVLDALWVPGRAGACDDVVLGLSTPGHYTDGNPACFGALVGRFANRIAHGRLEIDGREYQLPRNEENAQLHGGRAGFSWQPFEVQVEDGQLVLTRESPDGEMGYPGRLELTVRISLTPEGGLRYAYEAVTDRPTVVNLTAHPYFNLAGHAAGPERLGRHQLQVDADAFLPVRPDTLTPTGELCAVAGSAFDLRARRPLGPVFRDAHPQMVLRRGLDHNFVLRPGRDRRAPAASVVDPESGRRMDVYTDQPGIQVYGSNFLSDDLPSKDGATYGPYAGLCLETQHFPDSPNMPHFPSTLLRPGERWTSFTEYRFSVTEA
ncbi:MAG: galactose-1-epimerase [Phycisphaerae bacterium]|nr:galactose-1-epimerase [Phycisphaerae bacterium]